MKFGLNNSDLKSNNTGIVLNLLLTGSASTRAELSSKSGLTKMTVSNIVGALIQNDVLTETPLVVDNKPGRPTVRLSLSVKAPKVISIYLNESGTEVSLLDLSGTKIRSSSSNWDNLDAGVISQKVFAAVDDLIRASINERILCVSLVTSLPMDMTRSAINLPDSSAFEFKSIMNERYGLNVVAEYEEISSILSEFYFGTAKGIENTIYVSINQEIRSAALVGGKPLLTGNGRSVKLEHVSIDYNGLSCSCGNRGCLQSYVSVEVMEKKLRDITKMKADFIGFCEMQQKKNDSRIDWALKDMMDKLGFALRSASMLIDPAAIIIGGIGAFIPDRYFTKLEKMLSDDQHAITVVKEEVGEKRIGIVSLAPVLKQIFASEIVL